MLYYRKNQLAYFFLRVTNMMNEERFEQWGFQLAKQSFGTT